MKTATRTLKMLETVYINEAISRVHVSEWFKRLRESYDLKLIEDKLSDYL